MCPHFSQKIRYAGLIESSLRQIFAYAREIGQKGA
jgi:hypothetical protein